MSIFNGFDDLVSMFSGVGSTPQPPTSAEYDPSTNPYGWPSSAEDAPGLLDNYDDQASWLQYLKVLDASNQYNSAEAQKVRDWNEYMRDTQVSSYMKQLQENGINPILAVNSGFAGAAYPSSAMAQGYSGTAPYSNSSRVDAAIIRALGSVIGSAMNSAAKIITAK